MDMKKLIARMDAIESKKILKEDAAPTGFDGKVDEFVGGTAAAKVAAWLAHIKKLRAQGFSQAAADAEKSLAQVHPDYRMIAKQQQTAPMPEFRGSIAKALMQDMGVEEAPDDDGIERNADAVDSEGNPIRVASGGNLKSAGPGQRPGQYFPRDAVDASIDQADADAGAAAQAALDQQALGNMDMQVGQGAQRAPAQPDVGTPELNIGQGSQNAPVQGGEEELGTIDPNDLKRFGELLDKLEKGTGAAVKPAAQGYKGSAGAQAIQKLNPQIKDINKIYPGQQLKMPDGSTYTVKPGDTMDKIARGMRGGAGANPPPGATYSPQVMQGTMPAANTVREDDAILARIKAVKL